MFTTKDLKELLKDTNWLKNNSSIFILNKDVFDVVFKTIYNIEELTDLELKEYVSLIFLKIKEDIEPFNILLKYDHKVLKRKLENTDFFNEFSQEVIDSKLNTWVLKTRDKTPENKLRFYLILYNIKETLNLQEKINLLIVNKGLIIKEMADMMDLIFSEDELKTLELPLDRILKNELYKIKILDNKFSEVVKRSVYSWEDTLIKNIKENESILEYIFKYLKPENKEKLILYKLKLNLENFESLENDNDQKNLFKNMFNILKNFNEDGLVEKIINKYKLSLKKEVRMLSLFETFDINLDISEKNYKDFNAILFKMGFNFPSSATFEILSKFHDQFKRKELLYKMLGIKLESTPEELKMNKDTLFYHEKMLKSFKNEIFSFFPKETILMLMMKYRNYIALEVMYFKPKNINFDMEKMVDFLCDLLYYADDNLVISEDYLDLLDIKYKI